MIQTDPKKRPLLPKINEQLASSIFIDFPPSLEVTAYWHLNFFKLWMKNSWLGKALLQKRRRRQRDRVSVSSDKSEIGVCTRIRKSLHLQWQFFNFVLRLAKDHLQVRRRHSNFKYRLECKFKQFKRQTKSSSISYRWTDRNWRPAAQMELWWFGMKMAQLTLKISCITDRSFASNGTNLKKEDTCSSHSVMIRWSVVRCLSRFKLIS